MNILANICNPKEQHFQQQARTQAYKPMNDYIFQSRSMQRMRARHQPIQNPEQYKYQSWNHPYSISNFFMTQKGVNNGEGKQSLGGNGEYINYQSESALNQDQHNRNTKISFKEIPQALCGIWKEEEQGEKLFTKKEDFYSSLRSNDQTYGRGAVAYQGRNNSQEDNHLIQTDNTRFSKNQHLQNDRISSQNSHTYVLLSQQILRLKQENKQLKRIIEQEYKPMKELYNKLLSEQQEREYLISKLEWKVKELVKQMGTASGSVLNGKTVQHEPNLNNLDSKKEGKIIPKVESQKHFTQSSTHLPFKAFESNLNNIKIQQNKQNNYANLQNPNHSVNLNTVNDSRPFGFGQFNFTSLAGNNTYQKIPTQNSSQNTLQTPNLNNPQFHIQPYQNSGNIQQNNYFSVGTNNIGQANDYSLPSRNLGQNYQKPIQNFQISATFNQPTGHQSYYQPINTRFNN